MALVTKNDVTQIFAIQAPSVDLPPTFANYPRGWDTARSNNGKPTIKQFNYIQQRTDQNVLWIHQNGAALPYDAAMEYAEGAVVVKDGELQKKQGASWVPAANKGYNLDYFVSGKSYPLHAEIMLTNGDIVRSTVANNTVDPNVDMTGWKFNDNTVESIAELLAIPSPKNNQREYIKSYYAGENRGGGEFVYTASTTATQVNGFVMAAFGGVWRRVINPVHSIDEAGASPTQTATVNTNAINDILKFVKCVNVPHADYNVLPDIIKLNNGNTLFGSGQLVGNAPNTLMIADGTGIYIHADDTNTAIIRGIKLKNGYKSNGIFLRRAKNIFIDDVTVDGMSYGIVVAEKDYLVENSGGSQNIIIQNPKILNTRYWGIYLRGANISTETLKSQNIKVINPYFYNCNMAGFVASEGNVKNFVLENPVFDRCNVSMHFEHASDFTVINPKDYDVGKKADHVQANTEYPFVGWSMYFAFANDAQIIGGTVQAECYHLAGVTAKSKNIAYTNVTMKTNVFEGVGTADTGKNIFDNYSWEQCTTIREFIYHQAADAPASWLRDFSITNSKCKLGIAGNSGSGSYIVVNSPRMKNFIFQSNRIYNSTIRIAVEGMAIIKDNIWIDGTDNTQVVIDGLRGGLFGDFLEMTGNLFERAGGSVQGDSGIRVNTFTRARVDNVVRGTGSGYAYRFSDNYRVEIGGGMIYDFPLGSFIETGTTGGVTYLYRA